MVEMPRFLSVTWLRLCNLINVSRPNPRSLREKAIAVAGRVSMVKNESCLKVSCPVCLEAIQSSLDSDLKMILAVHMSLWHPEDVKLQWEMMQNRRQSNLHVPSFFLGAGLAAGIGTALAFLTRKHARSLVDTKERQLVFKLK